MIQYKQQIYEYIVAATRLSDELENMLKDANAPILNLSIVTALHELKKKEKSAKDMISVLEKSVLNYN